MPHTFGRRLLAVDPREALALEGEAGLSAQFSQLDELIGQIVKQSLSGKRVAMLTKTRARGYQLELCGLSQSAGAWIARAMSLEALQANGFWLTPEKASLTIGLLSTSWSLHERGRFGPQVSADERSSLALDNPEAIAAWSILIPALNLLYRPIYLRTVEAGENDRQAQIARWSDIATTLDVLGLHAFGPFEAIRYGNGWSKLSASERHQALIAYVDALNSALPEDAGSRLRLRLVQPLVEKYYDRAKADGAALQKQVVTTPLRPVLAGMFGGDWRLFVNYLGEQVHRQEHIATATPSVELVSPFVADIGAVARETDTTPDEVAAIAAAVFGSNVVDGTKGPDRLDVLRQFWDEFDAAHASQRPGMKSLWGLVDSGSLGPFYNTEVFHPGLYRRVLSEALITDVESLWAGHVWPRFPDRILTEWSPHARMAEAFGPALAFWEGVSLTAWFVCEGPTSRTEFSELPEYHAREIAALSDAGTPVDLQFLKKIRNAARLLGPPQPLWSEGEHSIEPGLVSVSIRTSMGSRREGFEKVRDLITEARRHWASRYLEDYLRGRQKTCLEDAAGRYHIAVNARGGKPPTLKQAAKDAAQATNLWLGGDLGEFYRRIRERCPAPIADGRLVKGSPDVFLRHLRDRLLPIADASDPHASTTAGHLVKAATSYVRWREATGNDPQPDQVKEFEYCASLMSRSATKTWNLFAQAIHESLLDTESGESLPNAPTAKEANSRDITPPPASTSPIAVKPSSSAEPNRPWWKRLFDG